MASIEYLDRFGRTIEPLDLSHTLIYGDIIVIGHHELFPERFLICTPESNYTYPRAEINSITCVEPEQLPDIQGRLALVIKHHRKNESPELNKGSANYYPYEFADVFKVLLGGKFETVLLFRVPDLSKQFKKGLLKQISAVLRPGGRFIGSGGFVEGKIPEEHGLRLEKAVFLMNHDYSGYYFKDPHIGFVFRKDKKKRPSTV